ncbi:MAG TPA: Mur ligase family protein [Longimicrobiales bacterium]
MQLAALAAALTGARPNGPLDGTASGISADSRRVRPGDVFVAVRGVRADGHGFLAEALARGAIAVVVQDGAAVPAGATAIVVPDTRIALAELSACWFGRPADRIPIVGITGTLGKTSVLSILSEILARAGIEAGTIGSLGIRFREVSRPTRLTTPDSWDLHAALAEMLAGGAKLVAMEVTSHALVQHRIHGLTFCLGAFTNLALLEHQDYHGSFRRYVEDKTRYFDHLQDGAPLVYACGDRLLHALMRRRRGITPIGCGPGGTVSVRAERRTPMAGKSRVTITVRRELPRIDGGIVSPVAFGLDVPLLGRPNVGNAALAATAALCAGAEVEHVQAAVAAMPPPRRRMQIVHRGRFTVLDDTVGHPDSITAVFEVAARLPHRRLHVVYAVRGRRGVEINRRDAEAIAIWLRRAPAATVVVTSSEDAADAANRVQPEEEHVVLYELRRHDPQIEFRPRLEDAVWLALDRAGRGDLVLLLGAQGMDGGAAAVARWLEAHEGKAAERPGSAP